MKAVIFDFDYTLGDSTDGIVGCVGYALERLGEEKRSFSEIRQTIGLSLEETYRTLTGNADSEQAAAFKRYFIEKADEIMAPSAVLYDGVKEMLKTLRRKGIKTGIVTTKFQYRIRQILKNNDAEDLMDVIVGVEDVTEVKPAPEALLLAVETLKLTKKEVLYVGDSYVDALAAERAGIAFAGVLTGITAAEEFEKYPCVYVGENVKVVMQFIKLS